MPTYDYFCPANEQTVEVQHSFSTTISNWGELCEKAGVEPGNTPGETPVERVISGGTLLVNKPSSKAEPKVGGGGGCGSGCGCHI